MSYWHISTLLCLAVPVWICDCIHRWGRENCFSLVCNRTIVVSLLLNLIGVIVTLCSVFVALSVHLLYFY